jgi:hypothetical protein
LAVNYSQPNHPFWGLISVKKQPVHFIIKGRTHVIAIPLIVPIVQIRIVRIAIPSIRGAILGRSPVIRTLCYLEYINQDILLTTLSSCVAPL